MKIFLASSYIRAYKKLTKYNIPLRDKIKKKILLFMTTPNNPSLKLHKLEGGLRDNWSFSVESDLRIILT